MPTEPEWIGHDTSPFLVPSRATANPDGSWTILLVYPDDLEPGITDPEARLAFEAAVEAFAAELDDDDAELAALSHAHPAAVSRVVAPEVP